MILQIVRYLLSLIEAGASWKATGSPNVSDGTACGRLAAASIAATAPDE